MAEQADPARQQARPQGEGIEVEGEFSTAEVTHVLEALRLEGQCYLKNHRLMQMAGGDGGAIETWHEEVTRRNLEGLVDLAEQMGLNLPFPKPLEERENEIKEEVASGSMEGLFTKGEALAEVQTAAKHLADFYAVSANLATHPEAMDAFRRGYENVMDQKPRVEKALEGTKQFFPPPQANSIKYVAEKGTSPKEFKEARGKTGGGSKGSKESGGYGGSS